MTTCTSLLLYYYCDLHFYSVNGFEFTQELSIFDLLGVHLYHGWLADPNDTVTYPVVSRFSYNQLVEYTINNMTSSDTHLQEEGITTVEGGLIETKQSQCSFILLLLLQ